MSKMIVNPDKETAKRIMNALARNDGYCPCVPTRSPATMCPCEKFQFEKKCCCNLYVEEKSNESTN
jgi:ferredoxin-thioredoxin reductase catalytic subunit